MTAENMDDEIEIKLNDDEKLKLIEFYMEMKHCETMIIRTETFK